MDTLSANATLLVIDVQQAFEHPRWGQRNNHAAEANIARLLAGWRGTGRPIIHVNHINPRAGSLFNPDSVGAAVKPEAEPKPGEPTITKDVNSAFIGTDLADRLAAASVRTLVIVGLTTDHCVSTTTRMAGNFGFETYVVADATATFERTGREGRHFTAEEMHDSALASLSGEFATIVTTDEVIGSLGTADGAKPRAG